MQLERDFKWGTVRQCISRGTKTTRAWRFRLSTLTNKNKLSWKFQLWPLVILMPLEVDWNTVPHLKVFTCFLEPSSGYGDGSAFTYHRTILKYSFYLKTGQAAVSCEHSCTLCKKSMYNIYPFLTPIILKSRLCWFFCLKIR